MVNVISQLVSKIGGSFPFVRPFANHTSTFISLVSPGHCTIDHEVVLIGGSGKDHTV